MICRLALPMRQWTRCRLVEPVAAWRLSAWALVLLIALHVLAFVHHQVIRKEPLLQRMR